MGFPPATRRPQRGAAAPEPSNPEEILHSSISFNENTTRRVSTDPKTEEFVVFDETYPDSGIYHGHQRTWNQLSDQMKAALRKAGRVNKKGKVIS